MAESKKPSAKHIIDVAQPGKSSPSNTSKPVIVSNRPILKDPMMAETSDEKDDKSIKVPSQKATVQPLSAPELEGDIQTGDKKTITQLAEEAASKKMTDADEEKMAETDQPELEPESEAKEDIEPKQSDEAKPATEDEAASDAKDSKTDGDKQKTPAEKDANAAAQQAKKDEAIQKLVDSKKYSLPINSVEQRKSKRFVAFGILLSLCLAVAWVNIALDAGLIELGGLKPLTHFFSN